MELPVYDVIYDEDGLGITAVSLVDRPAIECDFVALKKEEPVKFYFDDEKQEIVGPALIPDKLIYRVYENQEFFIRFSKDTIIDLAFKYFMDDRYENITIMHEESPDGNPFGCLVDKSKFYNTHFWIEEPDFQEAKNYGFTDIPDGTWFLGYKILDEELWKRIKGGELRGFSIEAYLDLKMP